MVSIEVRDAVVGYQDADRQRTLNGLSMTVSSGSIYALIGSSGCGKTTLLSCILGMKALESGTINVLGQKVCHPKILKAAHSIGFMPQDIALSPYLTIAETLNYFGNIFLMQRKDLDERSKMLMELLELHPKDAQIENLSGGQQRRVSLATALIHNPLILILDEPTVGLDSILREKIWNFLIESTQKTDLSIVITTHYIAEAQQSNRCGMMRDGVMLIEDSPLTILLQFGASNLDEAFLNLCKSIEPASNSARSSLSEKKSAPVDAGQKGTICRRDRKQRRLFLSQIIWTLLLKEWICLRRRKIELVLTLLFLSTLVTIFLYGPGGNPNGLKIGIVNYEVNNVTTCENHRHQNSSYRDKNYFCVYRHLSCHFIDEISDEDGTKIFYRTFDEAYADARTGVLTAVVTIQQNFTSALQELHENLNASVIDLAEIDIRLDNTDMQLAVFMQNRLFRAFTRFSRNLMVGCDYNEKFVNQPLHVTSLNGSVYDDFKRSLLPVFLIQSIFFQAVTFSSFSVAQTKVEGIWNRTLLAGVQPIEILLVQFFFSLFAITISFINGLLITFFSLHIADFNSVWVSFSLGLAVCTTGIFLGVMLSSLTKNPNFVVLFVFGGSFVAITLSGLFWPIEGQPSMLRVISYALPFTQASISLRNVVLKNAGLADSSVVKGFLVCLLWAMGTLLMAVVAIKRKKFT